MKHSKSIAVVLAAVVCATAFAAEADAQSRRGGGGSRGPSAGRAVQRGGGGPRGGGQRIYSPRGISPRIVGVRPYRSYYGYRPYYSYRPYYYRPGLSIGFYGGYGYGYPYAYGYPYGSYAYGYPYGYPYGSYAVGAYGSGGGYARGGNAYGGVRIQDAPHDAQVYADGYYAGIVDDFDGAFQHLDLEAGAHQIEIRIPGQPPLQYDVNVQPGQTLNLHVR